MIGNDELQLRPTLGLDSAARVDLLDRQGNGIPDGHAPGTRFAGQANHQTDGNFLRLRQTDAWCAKRRGAKATQ